MKFKPAAVLIAVLLLMCGCTPTQSSSPNSEISEPLSTISQAVSVDYSVLDIPADVGTNGIYTATFREQMLKKGLNYQQVEALVGIGYTSDEILTLTPEQAAVYSTCAVFRPKDESLRMLISKLYSYIEGMDDYFEQEAFDGSVVPQIVSYGESVLGRQMYYIRISDGNATPTKKIMLTFAIHGYEGETASDGAYLSEQACQVAYFYSLHPEYLNGAELIVVPMVNPDGVMNLNGGSKFGRGQSQGIDINRDFQTFEAAETVAMSDLIKSEEPDIFIDFHGWYDESYGNDELGLIFARYLGVPHVSSDYGVYQGYLYGHAKSLGSMSLLVEHSGIKSVNTADLILSLNAVAAMDLQ